MWKLEKESEKETQNIESYAAQYQITHISQWELCKLP